jgi:type I restriction enzyme S subunit
MKHYDSYKDSGIEWIGEIPRHWEVKRFKDCHHEVDDIVGSDWSKYSLLSLTKNGVVKRDIESGIGKFPESFETYKKVGFNDLIFCLYDIEETPRTVGLSKLNGMITGSYKIIKSINVIPEYTYYVYLTIDDSKGLKPYYTGLRNTVRTDTFNSIKYILPPLSEQEQIVSYLDDKTTKIDELIQKKLRKIDLLKEYRTSLINTVVTKGLNPDVPMKDSGLEWIGEIPSHWEISRFKYKSVLPLQYGLNTSSDNYIEEGIRFVRITDISEDSLLIEDNGKYLDVKDVPQEYFLNKYDVLFCRSGHTVGKSYFHLLDGNYTSGGYLVRLNFGSYVESKFVIYISKTYYYWDWIRLNTIVSTIENVNGEKYNNFTFPIPPLSEQEQIVSYLDEKTSQIDKTIDIEKKKIQLLKEYRQSLISNVVTGKIKVVSE